jgi:signal transduction histidine kinase
MSTGYFFQDLDLEKVKQIYKITSRSADWKSAIDQVLIFSRPYFIFDNIAVYFSPSSSDRTDVIFARATGRGRSKEADVSWGETIASRVVTEKKLIIEEPERRPQAERLLAPHILGLPLFISNALTGALIFVRFGGPPFEEGSLDFASFLADQVTSVLRRKSLDDLELELEKQRTFTSLQGDFINTISHEIRNPLGFIRGYTTTLLREDTDWDKKTQHDFLEIIDRETKNLTELIDDLLDSSRLQSGKMNFNFQPLSLDSIIRDEVSRAVVNNPGLIVRVEISDDLPMIRGDARRIAQVIDNLLDNSQKYAPGKIISVKAHCSNGYVVIEYNDQGPGIDQKFMPLVFSRFFRVPDTSLQIRGSGLGLSICKQIIESHNGLMEVTSTPGKGLTFLVRLPLERGKSTGGVKEGIE